MKKFVLSTLIFCCFVTDAFGSVPQEVIKGLGIYLATVVGSIALTGIQVAAHELGHALTNKLLTGDPISIELRWRRWGWCGVTKFQTSLPMWGNALRTAAGPLAGLVVSQLQFSILEYLEMLQQKKNHSSDRNSSFSYTPLPFLFNLYKDAYRGSGKLLTPGREFFLHLMKSLCCSSMLRQAAYGFLPIGIDKEDSVMPLLKGDEDPQGDGQKLWMYLLKCHKNQTPKLSRKIYGIINACVWFPTYCIAARGYYQNLF